MSKKQIALSIQITLFISVFIIGYFTYKSVEENKVINSAYPTFKNTAGDCPIIQKRSCVEESYSQVPIECPPQKDECNGQNGIEMCYKFQWKQGRKLSYCRMCGGDDIDHYNDRIIVKCNPIK